MPSSIPSRERPRIPLDPVVRALFRGLEARRAALDVAIGEFERDRAVALATAAADVGARSPEELLRLYEIDAAAGVAVARADVPEGPHADDNPTRQ